MFKKMLKDTFSTQRLVLSGGKKTWTEHLASQQGMLQPLGERSAQSLGNEGVSSKSYRLFCEIVDIKEEDRILIGSVTYSVDTVKEYNMGNTPHMFVILQEVQ